MHYGFLESQFYMRYAMMCDRKMSKEGRNFENVGFVLFSSMRFIYANE